MSAKMELITVFHFISATPDIIDGTTIDLNPRYQLLYFIISTCVIPIVTSAAIEYQKPRKRQGRFSALISQRQKP
jgi:predicted Co/Zn/Cd cation transporter (cation efflux family)